jgi:hypothetical protein
VLAGIFFSKAFFLQNLALIGPLMGPRKQRQPAARASSKLSSKQRVQQPRCSKFRAPASSVCLGPWFFVQCAPREWLDYKRVFTNGPSIGPLMGPRKRQPAARASTLRRSSVLNSK